MLPCCRTEAVQKYRMVFASFQDSEPKKRNQEMPDSVRRDPGLRRNRGAAQPLLGFSAQHFHNLYLLSRYMFSRHVGPPLVCSILLLLHRKPLFANHVLSCHYLLVMFRVKAQVALRGRRPTGRLQVFGSSTLLRSRTIPRPYAVAFPPPSRGLLMVRVVFVSPVTPNPSTLQFRDRGPQYRRPGQ